MNQQELIDEIQDLLLLLAETRLSKKGLAGRLVSLSFRLEDEIISSESGQGAVAYIAKRFTQGASIRQTAKELGWSHSRLRRFCLKQNICHPKLIQNLKNQKASNGQSDDGG